MTTSTKEINVDELEKLSNEMMDKLASVQPLAHNIRKQMNMKSQVIFINNQPIVVLVGWLFTR